MKYSETDKLEKGFLPTSYPSSYGLLLAALLFFGILFFFGCQIIYTTNAEAGRDQSSFYCNVFAGIRTRAHEMNSRGTLLYMTAVGTISKDILASDFPEVPDFDAFLSDTDAYFASSNSMDQSLISPSSSVQELYSPLKAKTLSAIPSKLNLIAYVGLTKSLYSEMMGWSPE